MARALDEGGSRHHRAALASCGLVDRTPRVGHPGGEPPGSSASGTIAGTERHCGAGSRRVQRDVFATALWLQDWRS